METETAEPQILELEEMHLVGMSFFGDPFRSHAGWTEENEIGRTWKRLYAYLVQPGAAVRSKVAYELCVQHPETLTSGEFEVFAGHELQDEGEVPIQMVVKHVPAGRYARFTVSGTAIGTDLQMMVAIWLEEHGYAGAAFDLIRYDERFKGVDNLAESTVDVFVPLAPR